jgi:hypothetical protein
MHSQTAIRFYEIQTPLTEAVLPESGNFFNNCVFMLSVIMEKNNESSENVVEF